MSVQDTMFGKHQLWLVRNKEMGGDRLLSAVDKPEAIENERAYWRSFFPDAKLEYRDRDANGRG